MLIEESVCYRHHLIIEPPLIAFRAANKQYRRSSRIEGIEDPDWPAGTLNPQLSHRAMRRPFHIAGVGKGQHRAASFEFPNMSVYILLPCFGQCLPPNTELIGVLNRPGHLRKDTTIPSEECRDRLRYVREKVRT